MQTAEALDISFRRTPTLREIGFGQWEGWSWAELLAEHGAWARRYFAGDPTFQAPGGELLADVVERGRKFIQEADLAGTQGDVVVVGHGGALRGLLMSLLDLPARAMPKFSLSNASVTIVEVVPEMIRLQSLNQTAHLETED